MTDPAEINVDELRRRARRRLVGAIVLALGAAVIVPMLLESDPKPLGESVAVKIPPVDDGKFVNRLSDSAASKEPRKDAADAPRKPAEGDKAPAATPAPPSRPPKYDTQLPGDKGADTAAPSPAAGAEGKAAKDVAASDAAAKDAAPRASEPAPPPGAAPGAPAPSTPTVAPPVPPKPEPKAESAPAKAESTARPDTPAKPDTKAAAPPPAAPRAEPAPAPAAAAIQDGFSVQLAAFSDDKGANALANRLKRGGYPAYTEPLKTSRGTLWRVRVGPYPSREAANGVRDKLKAEGQNGIVAAAH